METALLFSIMGNIFSFFVSLSPLPTFYEVYKRKSTEGFQSIPYVVGLFNSMLWIYYSLVKGDIMLVIIIIRCVGIAIQIFYLGVFVFYAPKKARMDCLKLIMLFIVIVFGLYVLLTQILTKGTQRDVIVGRVFVGLSSFCVFVAALSVMIQVIKSKSVEYMPILLLVCQAITAFVWLLNGLLLGDFNIWIPNTIGITLCIFQFILYFVYKNKKPIINDIITENGVQKSENDEPSVIKVKTQNTIDMVKPKAFTQINVPNPHGHG